ncbi:MAG: hypothetical protein LUO91_03225 [Methanomicrobiales archaeon]|nr:hypothetical protein [Methanomicrobiales archaeon]MDD1654701.1 hypothetical protein [Methanomicrobiales archaeon]
MILLKVLHLPLAAAAIVAGAIGGYLIFQYMYLPATGGLGITFQGPLQAPYLMAGQAINLLVLIAFVIAGAIVAIAIVRAVTD